MPPANRKKFLNAAGNATCACVQDFMHLLRLIVEIKGFRREDAKEKKSTMETYWVPGVNHLGTQGRWAFAEFTEVYQIDADFKAKVETKFAKMVEQAAVARGG